MKGRKEMGFSLIELLTVLAIVGILVALAIPSYSGYAIRTQAAEAMTVVTGIQDDIVAHWNATGTMPDDAALGRNATSTQGKFISQVAVVTGGEVVTTFGNDANAAISGTTLNFTPYTSGDGTVSWQCGDEAMPAALTAHGDAVASTTVLDEYLPATCR